MTDLISRSSVLQLIDEVLGEWDFGRARSIGDTDVDIARTDARADVCDAVKDARRRVEALVGIAQTKPSA